MNFKKLIYSVSPKILARVVSLVLALVVALLCIRIGYFVDGDESEVKPNVQNGQENSEATENTEENETNKPTNEAFNRENAANIGSVVASRGAVVCSLTDRLLLADKFSDTPISSGDAVVFAVSLMTVKAANEGKISLTDEAVCPASAAQSSGYSVSAHILPIGRRMQIIDILKCMLFQGGTSFAITLAVHISGSVEKFTIEMNEYLSTLGLSCEFSDPCGDKETMISPHDFAVLMKHFCNESVLKEIFKSNTPVSISVGQGVDLLVKNDFFTTVCTPYQAKNDGISGGKICKNGVGVVLFNKSDKDYLVIVMGSIEPFSDILMLYSAYVLV